jgi:hypothetical protein
MTERTESEIFEAYEAERSALADAQAEIKAMQKHRITLLTTGTPEDVLAWIMRSVSKASKLKSPPRAWGL